MRRGHRGRTGAADSSASASPHSGYGKTDPGDRPTPSPRFDREGRSGRVLLLLPISEGRPDRGGPFSFTRRRGGAETLRSLKVTAKDGVALEWTERPTRRNGQGRQVLLLPRQPIRVTRRVAAAALLFFGHSQFSGGQPGGSFGWPGTGFRGVSGGLPVCATSARRPRGYVAALPFKSPHMASR